MGRTERELNPLSGPVQQFAYDLRMLRFDAGSPSYRELSRRAQYAPSVLSRAASGRELPSRNVALAYVAACGGDTEAWRERWTALSAELRRGCSTSQPAAADNASEGDQPAGTSDDVAGLAGRPGESRLPRRWRRPRRLRERLLIAGVGVALGATFGIVTTSAPASGGPRASAPTPAAPARHSAIVADPQDGIDPVVAGCAGSATTIATADIRLSRPVTIGHAVLQPGAVIGTVELRYSPHCRAGWSRVSPAGPIAKVHAGTVEAVISRASDKTYSAFGAMKITVFYTDILLMDGSCLSASGTIAFGQVRATAQTACFPPPTG